MHQLLFQHEVQGYAERDIISKQWIEAACGWDRVELIFAAPTGTRRCARQPFDNYYTQCVLREADQRLATSALIEGTTTRGPGRNLQTHPPGPRKILSPTPPLFMAVESQYGEIVLADDAGLHWNGPTILRDHGVSETSRSIRRQKLEQQEWRGLG